MRGITEMEKNEKTRGKGTVCGKRTIVCPWCGHTMTITGTVYENGETVWEGECLYCGYDHQKEKA